MAILKINPINEVFEKESVIAKSLEFSTDLNTELYLVISELFVAKKGEKHKKHELPGNVINIPLRKDDIEYLAGFFNSLVSNEKRNMMEYKEDQDDTRAHNLIVAIREVTKAVYEVHE